MKRIVQMGLTLLCAGVAGLSLAQAPQGGARGGARGEARGGVRAGDGDFGVVEGQQMMLARLLRDPAMCQEAGISAEQAETLQAKMLEATEKREALQAELRAASLRQAELLADPNASEADLMAMVDDMGRIRTEMARDAMRGLLAVREVLTPEQIAQARVVLQERMRARTREQRGDAERGAQRERRERPEGARERPEGARERPEGGGAARQQRR